MKRAPAPSPEPVVPSVYLSQNQAAEILHLNPKTLEQWRWKKIGPPFTKVGRVALYNETLLYAWLDQKTQKASGQ